MRWGVEGETVSEHGTSLRSLHQDGHSGYMGAEASGSLAGVVFLGFVAPQGEGPDPSGYCGGSQTGGGLPKSLWTGSQPTPSPGEGCGFMVPPSPPTLLSQGWTRRKGMEPGVPRSPWSQGT